MGETSSVVSVPLASIMDGEPIRKAIWPREHLDGERVGMFAALYRDTPDAVPPVQLAPVPVVKTSTPAPAGPRYYIADGWHRVNGMRRACKGKKGATIPAIIRADLTTPEAIYLEAARVSSVSSKPLTARERSEAASRLVETYPRLSDREIARLIGVSHVTVGKKRSAFRRAAERLGRALTSDGASTAAGTSSQTTDLYIEDRLIKLLARGDADELNQDDLRAVLDDEPELRPVARRWGAIIYSAAQPSAPQAAGPAIR